MSIGVQAISVGKWNQVAVDSVASVATAIIPMALMGILEYGNIASREEPIPADRIKFGVTVVTACSGIGAGYALNQYLGANQSSYYIGMSAGVLGFIFSAPVLPTLIAAGVVSGGYTYLKG